MEASPSPLLDLLEVVKKDTERVRLAEKNSSLEKVIAELSREREKL